MVVRDDRPTSVSYSLVSLLPPIPFLPPHLRPSVFSARTMKHAYLLAALIVAVLVAVMRHLPPPYEVEKEELAAAAAALIASLNIHALDMDTLRRTRS
ncbi:unnamed protein product [Cuscuta campestris]|uniref:Uncharacterized protein n=1 Tax=Cuscuta campestris TaxID=132261 RepID=A0A484NGY1_9ASTE|nr:unnamed protein product [Cuscuta campestris]